MIKVDNKKKCTGCSACANSCPINVIEMKADEEGFLYPQVDERRCIECHKCENVCPFTNDNRPIFDAEICYAAYNKCEIDRERSSSGGIFIAIARKIISDGGVVFGAAYDRDFLVHHIEVSDEESLGKIIGSKYMQSRIGTVYKDVERRLKEGKQVLFVGSACQIAGLKNYLKCDISKLLLVDFICLGAPSPKVWGDYLETFFDKSKVCFVNFKDKTLGWHRFSLRINDGKDFVRDGRQTYFFSGYFKGLYSRPSCSECIFKIGNRVSDITISDCWGYEQIAPELDDNRGLSSIVCHSDKGIQAFEEIKNLLVWKESDVSLVKEHNSNYCTSAAFGMKRKAFWSDYERLEKSDLFEKYCKPEKNNKYIRKIRHICKKILLKIRG